MIMRVCLPIFAQDILDSLNMLDLNSSASKSLKSVNMQDRFHQNESSNAKEPSTYDYMSASKKKQPENVS
jgi:hypothetical protein